MRKVLIVFCLFLLVAGIAAAQSVNSTMYVAIRSVALKSGTGLFASTRGTLEYGDRVTVTQVSGNKVEVRSASNLALIGWTAVSNLTPRQVVAGTTSTATAREVALAGKGFNQEIEDSYRSQQNLNYADVDTMEEFIIDESVLFRFLEEGRLAMGE